MKFTKALVSSLLFTAVLGLNTVKAEPLNQSFSFKKFQQSLCEDAAQNKVIKLRNELRQARTHIRTVYSQINCKGNSLLNLARASGSQKVVSYLEAKIDLKDEALLSRFAVK
ncbi:MAG: DUF3718 domain-containing protein [Kangiellaceae bacterium]|nr:DUF3718 domain-containing protein [Kangiellaceae bacterium]